MGLSDMISSSHLGVQSGDFSGFSSCQTRVTHLSGHIMRSISLDSWLMVWTVSVCSSREPEMIEGSLAYALALWGC